VSDRVPRDGGRVGLDRARRTRTGPARCCRLHIALRHQARRTLSGSAGRGCCPERGYVLRHRRLDRDRNRQRCQSPPGLRHAGRHSSQRLPRFTARRFRRSRYRWCLLRRRPHHRAIPLRGRAGIHAYRAGSRNRSRPRKAREVRRMIAVLGGGAGGLSSTVELVKAGHTVHLWNRNLARFDPYRAECAIPYRGVLGSGRVEPALMTDDLRTALEGAEAVVVSLPSIAHPRLFADLAAERCDIPIVLNPGHTGGALHLRTAFASVGAPVPPVVEFSTLTYVARVDGDGTVNVT